MIQYISVKRFTMRKKLKGFAPLSGSFRHIKKMSNASPQLYDQNQIPIRPHTELYFMVVKS